MPRANSPEMPFITEIKEESDPADVIVISSDSESDSENNTDGGCLADTETSDTEAVKIEDMPLLEEFPPRVDESAPAPGDPEVTSDDDSHRLIISE